MPMPKPHDGEEHDAFISRCNSEMSGEFPDNDQRNAVCQSQWDDKGKMLQMSPPLFIDITNLASNRDASSRTLQRAYSMFAVKSFNEDQRVIEGIATTPTPDRVGDVVEPKGGRFKLPLPWLWQHNSEHPIGEIVQASVSGEGITIKAKMPHVTEPGKLKERLDEAWQSIKYGLVKGLSIGFRPLEDPEPIKGTWGLRFKAWELMEISAVTVPANAAANIQMIKSIDQQSLSAALRAKTGVQVALSQPLGAAGTTQGVQKVKTFKEQIAAFEARRAANAAAAAEIMTKAGESGSTLDDESKQKFDGLNMEIKEIDEHLERLRVSDALNVQKAVPVKPDAGHSDEGRVRVPYGQIRVETKLEPGIRFARMAMCVARSKLEGKGYTPEEYYRGVQRWMDSAPEVAVVLKANEINAADTTTSGWASQIAYAQDIASEFIEYLRPMTIIGRIPGWRRVPFNIRVGSMTTGLTGYWVGQGQGIPLSQGVLGSATLGITKVAGVAAIDKELARVSSPNAEALVRGDLARACAAVADLSLIDPNQGGVANVQPASLTYGVTPVTPTGATYATFVADWKTLTSTALAANLSLSGAVLVMSETTAQALSMMVTSLGNPQFPGLTMTGGTIQGLPVITSQQANISGSPQYSQMIVLIFPGEVLMADDGVATVEASDQVSLEMMNSTGSTIQSTATATGASLVSMWQTESIAIKAVRYVNWTKARTQACAFIQAAAYTG